MKLFSIPYNGTNPTEYLQEIEKRKQYVGDIFSELPYFPSCQKTGNHFKNMTYDDFCKNCEDFLYETIDCGIPRYVTLNSPGYYRMFDEHQLNEAIHKVKEQIKKFKIQGAMVTNFKISQELRNEFGEDFKLIISTNSPVYSICSMRKWKLLGVDTITQPRIMTRNIDYFKKMKNAGFKIRLMLNESCSFFCNNHGICGMILGGRGCLDRSHWLQRTYIIPRWLDILDEYVDSYKIMGRLKTTEQIFKVFDHYIKREDCSLRDILYVKENIYEPFNTSEIPDELLFCKTENCDKCNICSSIYEKYPYINNTSNSFITYNE